MAFYDRATALVDKRRATAVIYLDLSKAFDAVQHNTLVSKLQRHGYDGWTTWWITNWLDGHAQRPTVNNSMYKWRPVTRGFPQASVLGLLLFSIFVINMYSETDYTSASLPMTPSFLVWFTCWRERMPSKGTLTGLRGGPV